ncbi:swr complex subunit [Elasticomyces elasticus]|nr:swr complex subunit [Elasticomyces elasticus]
MADLIRVVDEEDYESSADEDFNPNALPAPEEDISSSSEDELVSGNTVGSRKPAKKRKAAVALEELDSGDEATIQASKGRRKRKELAEDDSGGEGGLIKTRAQRRVEAQERAEFRTANGEGVTVDVDVLWANLSKTPVGRPPPVTAPTEGSEATYMNGHVNAEAMVLDPPFETAGDGDGDDMITIEHTYEFAGERHVGEKRVRKDSVEAKLYLPKKSNGTSQVRTAASKNADGQALRRPLKRASLFEPNPTGEVKGLAPDQQRLRTPSRADVLIMEKRAAEEKEREDKAKAKKLTTVEKSQLDWDGYVRENNLQEDLDQYGKSKESYLARQGFLGRAEGRREEDGKRAREKAKAQL